MPIAVGSQAPDFKLKSKTAAGVSEISLSAHRGQKNTVLLFFPLAFTGVCTTEMCDVSAGLSQYAALNAEVIAISVDSPFAQEAWANKEKITLPLASDLNKKPPPTTACCCPISAGSAPPPRARPSSSTRPAWCNTASRRRRRRICRTSMQSRKRWRS